MGSYPHPIHRVIHKVIHRRIPCGTRADASYPQAEVVPTTTDLYREGLKNLNVLNPLSVIAEVAHARGEGAPRDGLAKIAAGSGMERNQTVQTTGRPYTVPRNPHLEEQWPPSP